MPDSQKSVDDLQMNAHRQQKYFVDALNSTPVANAFGAGYTENDSHFHL